MMGFFFLIILIGIFLFLLTIVSNDDKSNRAAPRISPDPSWYERLDGEPYVPDRSEGSVTTQRDKMRELFKANAGDEQKTIAAYAAAERAGEVSRRSNDYALNPEEYARRLLADGVHKAWID